MVALIFSSGADLWPKSRIKILSPSKIFFPWDTTDTKGKKTILVIPSVPYFPIRSFSSGADLDSLRAYAPRLDTPLFDHHKYFVCILQPSLSSILNLETYKFLNEWIKLFYFFQSFYQFTVWEMLNQWVVKMPKISHSKTYIYNLLY